MKTPLEEYRKASKKVVKIKKKIQNATNDKTRDKLDTKLQLAQVDKNTAYLAITYPNNNSQNKGNSKQAGKTKRTSFTFNYNRSSSNNNGVTLYNQFHSKKKK